MIIPNDRRRLSDPHPGPRRLVFAGEAIVDVVMRVPALPERGGDILATSSEVTVGGGFNVMAAAARQGLPVLYAGGHGTGPWGDLVRAALAAEGIGLLRPPDPDRDTGFDVALVEPDAERTFVTHLGAEAVAGPGAGTRCPAGRATPSTCPATAWSRRSPARSSATGRRRCRRASLLFVDPGPLVAQIPAAVLDPVLARCDWLSCNQREAALLTGASRPREGGPPPARPDPARERHRPLRPRRLPPRPPPPPASSSTEPRGSLRRARPSPPAPSTSPRRR